MSTTLSSSLPFEALLNVRSYERATERRMSRPETEAEPTRGVAGEDESAATKRLRTQIRTIGPHFRMVLITGERGARKEEVARGLHAASPVAAGPFVVCDAGSMEGLRKLEGSAAGGEVYGELALVAKGGTIFFPELGLFSTASQAKVVELLGRFGEEQGMRIRVIGSVSGDVPAMVAGGMLRSDLRERLGVIEMAVAPLRERIEDIAVVAERILARTATRGGRETPTISVDALRELQRRGWPGNDRELESALRMAALASGGEPIEAWHLPAGCAAPEARTVMASGVGVVSAKLQDVVEAHVQEVLRRCAGNKVKAAEVLGISRSTLYRMLETATIPAM